MSDDARSDERLAAIRKLRANNPNDPLIQAMTAESEATELEWQKISKGCIPGDGSFDFAQLLRNVADEMDGGKP